MVSVGVIVKQRTGDDVRNRSVLKVVMEKSRQIEEAKVAYALLFLNA